MHLFLYYHHIGQRAYTSDWKISVDDFYQLIYDFIFLSLQVIGSFCFILCHTGFGLGGKFYTCDQCVHVVFSFLMKIRLIVWAKYKEVKTKL